VSAPEVSDLAERALAATRPGEALATVTRERSLMLRFAHSAPTQATSVDDLTVEIAALRDGHVGRAATNGVDLDALERCAGAAGRAAEAAARSAGAGDYPGFPAPSPARGHRTRSIPHPCRILHEGHDVDTAVLDPGRGGEALDAACAAARAAGAEASGIWTTASVETAIACSTGTFALDRLTDAFVKVVAFEPGGRSGYGSQTAVAARALDPAAVAARAAQKAVAGAGEPVELAPGTYTVVAEPPATHELLGVLARTAFDGLAHAESRGALTGGLGTRVAAPTVNLSDSPRHPATLPRAFDAEGVPKAPLPLIQDGVAHRVVHDTRSAALAGGASTGHAVAAGGGAEGPLATNLAMAGGGAADERELCRAVERGIYVTRLWYTNVLRPRETLFTAVTRDGTFLIEDGEVTRPLADMRLTDSALGMLSRVEALGARSVLVSDGELYGRRFATGSVCPPLRIGAVAFTGSAARG